MSRPDKRDTKANAASPLLGPLRMVREDRRYSAEMFALQSYLEALERLILPPPLRTRRL